MQFVYDVCNVKLPLHAKGFNRGWGWGRGGKAPKKPFSISYMLNNRKKRFQLIFSIQNLSNVESLLADNLRAEPTIFLMKQISFI